MRAQILRPFAISAVLTCMAVLASACAPAGATDSPEAAVLRLELAQCHNGNEHRASAFAINDGYAVTVAHAFEDIDGFTVRTADQRELTAEVVYLDPERDIAILELTDGAAPESLLLRSAGEDQDGVTLVTFAESDGPERKDADILRFVRLTLDGVGDRAGIEIGADISSGDSGGPLLDADGLVIGMVFATSRQGERGWAIATSEIERAFEARQSEPVERICEPR